MDTTQPVTSSLPTFAQRFDAIPSWFLTKDGYWLYARLIQPEDEARLLQLFDLLSSTARQRRFHTNVDHLDQEIVNFHAHAFATVDNLHSGGAVVALDHRGVGEKIVGVVRLGMPKDGVAEVAVVVRDDFQGRGVGRALLRRMPMLAQRMGVHTVVGSIEADNLPALRLFRRLHLPMTTHTSRAVTDIEIILSAR